MRLEEVLLSHFRRYPEMEIADAVKLVYQNEFGSAHLLRDMGESLKRLREEMAGLEADPDEPLFEAIGNGLCRMNLRACLAKGIDTEEVHRLCLDAARAVNGTLEGFEAKLAALAALPFDGSAVRAYLDGYRLLGYPPVHHSPRYARAYAPAYRVVLETDCALDTAAGAS